MGFKQIKFGMAAAEKEKSDSPNLLIEGFLDAYGYIDKIENENKFLVLGPKGSGKSAIGSRLELLSKNSDSRYTQQHYLKDFPYKSFTEILPGGEAPEIKYPNNWEFILLTALLDSFRKDHYCICDNEFDLQKTIEIFENLGLIPKKDLAQIVKTTTKKDFKIGLKDFFSYQHSSEYQKNHFTIKMLFDYLKEVCYSVRTKNHHFIIVDGLDTVLTHRETQYQSLSALILAADRMNQNLQESNVNAKIVILCRTDLLDKLSDPNKNKVVSDSGIILEWYDDVRDAKATNLVNLINLRAKISLQKDVDIFNEFIPEKIMGDKPTVKVLLDHTRHTPRDIIQLMNKIQEHTKGKIPTLDDIWNGIRMYSIQYFMQEIHDELVGFLPNEERDGAFQLITAIGKSKFFIKELEDMQNRDSRFKNLDLNKILTIFYNCNAIGNFNLKSGRYSWKYRNRYSSFDPNQHIAVHLGLHKALNISDYYIEKDPSFKNFY